MRNHSPLGAALVLASGLSSGSAWAGPSATDVLVRGIESYPGCGNLVQAQVEVYNTNPGVHYKVRIDEQLVTDTGGPLRCCPGCTFCQTKLVTTNQTLTNCNGSRYCVSAPAQKIPQCCWNPSQNCGTKYEYCVRFSALRVAITATSADGVNWTDDYEVVCDSSGRTAPPCLVESECAGPLPTRAPCDQVTCVEQ